MNNRNTGSRYERIAAAWLKEIGFEILECNYRTSFGEIDLIAREGDTLCFIEVKYRSSDQCGYPAEAVTRKKMLHIRRCAGAYLACNGDLIRSAKFRFDVVEILGGQIRILRDAFRDCGSL